MTPTKLELLYPLEVQKHSFIRTKKYQQRAKITISSGEGLGDTEVVLSPVNEMVETGYVATYLTPGLPVEFDAITGEWFKIGVSMQNDTDTDITVYVEVEGVEVRIE